MALNKHQILAAKDWNPIPVEVPEWGGEVLIKVMNVREGIGFQERIAKGESTMISLLSYVVVDDDGKYVFTSEDDLKGLQEKNPRVLDRLFDIAVDHNSLVREGNSDGSKPVEGTETNPKNE
jgi:hypothetical protein